MFKINHEEAGKGFELIAKGDYEVTVINYEMKKSKADNNVISVDYEIRSDVPQAFQGQKVLYDNFTITDNAMWRLQAVAKAAGFPNGMEFSSYKEWADTLLNKNLIITVGHRPYNDKTYVQVDGFKASKVGTPSNTSNYTRVDEDPFSNSSGPIEVSDDDLPF